MALWSSASFLGALLVVIGALVLAIAMLISRALSGVFGVALYRYALEGEAVGGFTQDELESAVKRKKGSGPATQAPADDLAPGPRAARFKTRKEARVVGAEAGDADLDQLAHPRFVVDRPGDQLDAGEPGRCERGER